MDVGKVWHWRERLSGRRTAGSAPLSVIGDGLVIAHRRLGSQQNGELDHGALLGKRHGLDIAGQMLTL